MMTEKKFEKMEHANLPEGIDKRRRQLLKIALGSAVAYTVPLMASFPMEGLTIGRAKAGGVVSTFGTPLHPPGLAGSNQSLLPGRAFQFSDQPPGKPFNDPSKPVGPAPPWSGHVYSSD
jgi:hypothetical protein